jgi:hypothetical protein
MRHARYHDHDRHGRGCGRGHENGSGRGRGLGRRGLGGCPSLAAPRTREIETSFRPAAEAAICPLCDNHCPTANPACGKGVAYLKKMNATQEKQA